MTTTIRVFLLTLVLAVGGCGNESEEQQVRHAVTTLEQAFDDGDLDQICATMNGAARHYVTEIGHLTASSCAVGLKPIVAGIQRSRKAGEAAPKVSRITLQATVELTDGNRPAGEATFAKEDGEWRLNSMFGPGHELSELFDPEAGP